MKTYFSLLVVIVSVFMASTAQAQRGYSPPGTYFSATGSLTVSKIINGQNNIWNCAVSFNATVGPSAGGSPARSSTINITSWSAQSGKSNDPCIGVTIQPNSISANVISGCVGNGCGSSSKSGIMRGFVMGVPGNQYFCNGTGQFDNVNIDFENNGASQSRIGLGLGETIDGCHITIIVATCPDINFFF